MRGYVTDRDLGPNEALPGIADFFESLLDKPETFLELVSAFEHWGDRRVVLLRPPAQAAPPK